MATIYIIISITTTISVHITTTIGILTIISMAIPICGLSRAKLDNIFNQFKTSLIPKTKEFSLNLAAIIHTEPKEVELPLNKLKLIDKQDLIQHNSFPENPSKRLIDNCCQGWASINGIQLPIFSGQLTQSLLSHVLKYLLRRQVNDLVGCESTAIRTRQH